MSGRHILGTKDKKLDPSKYFFFNKCVVLSMAFKELTQKLNSRLLQPPGLQTVFINLTGRRMIGPGEKLIIYEDLL